MRNIQKLGEFVWWAIVIVLIAIFLKLCFGGGFA